MIQRLPAGPRSKSRPTPKRSNRYPIPGRRGAGQRISQVPVEKL
jgi:hypothetical protein